MPRSAHRLVPLVLLLGAATGCIHPSVMPWDPVVVVVDPDGNPVPDAVMYCDSLKFNGRARHANSQGVIRYPTRQSPPAVTVRVESPTMGSVFFPEFPPPARIVLDGTRGQDRIEGPSATESDPTDPRS